MASRRHIPWPPVLTEARQTRVISNKAHAHTHTHTLLTSHSLSVNAVMNASDIIMWMAFIVGKGQFNMRQLTQQLLIIVILCKSYSSWKRNNFKSWISQLDMHEKLDIQAVQPGKRLPRIAFKCGNKYGPSVDHPFEQ